jgi:Leucine-rich repeat (LRR) protein
MTEIPTELTFCSKLQTLNISRNRITSIPPGFNNLNELKTLDASHNMIRRIGDTVESIATLEDLNFDGNDLIIDDIPPRTMLLLHKVELPNFLLYYAHNFVCCVATRLLLQSGA